ncbi:hypothetical protein E2C01_061962 [Portunus trituberculatus]|uniref:Uncharacterized protein n=1 Tax=Portunus trituberculatus TaxID=210409 RepID=A0A5B7HFS8_PORTR|nr:hypothetical protein [Portunus trituberculatus]
MIHLIVPFRLLCGGARPLGQAFERSRHEKRGHGQRPLNPLHVSRASSLSSVLPRFISFVSGRCASTRPVLICIINLPSPPLFNPSLYRFLHLFPT